MGIARSRQRAAAADHTGNRRAVFGFNVIASVAK
jgi:hypothetical protein